MSDDVLKMLSELYRPFLESIMQASPTQEYYAKKLEDIGTQIESFPETYPQSSRELTNIARQSLYGDAGKVIDLMTALAPAFSGLIGAVLGGATGIGAGIGAGVGSAQGMGARERYLQNLEKEKANVLQQQQALMQQASQYEQGLLKSLENKYNMFFSQYGSMLNTIGKYLTDTEKMKLEADLQKDLKKIDMKFQEKMEDKKHKHRLEEIYWSKMLDQMNAVSKNIVGIGGFENMDTADLIKMMQNLSKANSQLVQEIAYLKGMAEKDITGLYRENLRKAWETVESNRQIIKNVFFELYYRGVLTGEKADEFIRDNLKDYQEYIKKRGLAPTQPTPIGEIKNVNIEQATKIPDMDTLMQNYLKFQNVIQQPAENPNVIEPTPSIKDTADYFKSLINQLPKSNKLVK